MVISVKLGNVVHLDIVSNTISEATESVTFNPSINRQKDLHAMSSRSVSIILSSGEIVGIMEFELLLQRETVKLSS